MTNRILVVGSAATGSLEGYYARAFSSVCSSEVHFFNVDLNWPKISRTSLTRRAVTRVLGELRARCAAAGLLRYLTRTRDYFEVVIVVKGAEFSAEILARARGLQSRAIWVNINPDDPFAVSSRRILTSLRSFDVYCTWSRRLVSALEDYGCRRVLYLPFGYDRVGHARPPERLRRTDGIVSFCGAWDPQREAILTELVCFNVNVYGFGWERLSRHSPLRNKARPANIYGAELARVVNDSDAALNLLRPQNVGSHNMRTFEIPAMGGLMVTTRSAEQEGWFPDGSASVMFDTVEELKDKLMLVTSVPEAYNDVRRQAEERLIGHSYEDRARELADYLAISGR